MGEAEISKEMRHRLHAHVFSDVGSKHYDQYYYYDDKKAALDKWAAWLIEQAKIVTYGTFGTGATASCFRGASRRLIAWVSSASSLSACESRSESSPSTMRILAA